MTLLSDAKDAAAALYGDPRPDDKVGEDLSELLEVVQELMNLLVDRGMDLHAAQRRQGQRAHWPDTSPTLPVRR